jgi:hypothetical protein
MVWQGSPIPMGLGAPCPLERFRLPAPTPLAITAEGERPQEQPSSSKRPRLEHAIVDSLDRAEEDPDATSPGRETDAAMGCPSRTWAADLKGTLDHFDDRVEELLQSIRKVPEYIETNRVLEDSA